MPPVTSTGITRFYARVSWLDRLFLGGLLDFWLRADGSRSLSFECPLFFLWLGRPGTDMPCPPGLEIVEDGGPASVDGWNPIGGACQEGLGVTI